MLERYLPLGSVVKIKENAHLYMITGRMMSYENENGEIISKDYHAVLYPFGVLNTNEQIMFNHDQIEKMLFIGYQDFREAAFQKELEKHRNDE